MSKMKIMKVIKPTDNFVSGAYAAASCTLLDHSYSLLSRGEMNYKVILRYRILLKFQVLPIVAYSLFICLLCSDSD